MSVEYTLSDDQQGAEQAATTLVPLGLGTIYAGHQMIEPHQGAESVLNFPGSAETDTTLRAMGTDYLSNCLGSWAICAGAIAGSERLAHTIESRGHQRVATLTRRLGNVAAVAGSAAYQVASENMLSPQFGVTDTWDLAAGVLGTVAGLLHVN